MDAQRKKGVLDILVLSVLTTGPSYGYEIIQRVSGVMEVSESTMYPILRRLENGKDVETYSQEYNGRIRKYFSITEKGRERIAEFLEEWDEMKAIYEFVRLAVISENP
ncbi:MAG: PadR family transcriptional regulator [Ruminococcus sp.]|nr:PadR family transcriptional regulator [Ruminococcus sp.]